MALGTTPEALTEQPERPERPERRRRFVRAESSSGALTPHKVEALRVVALAKFLSTPQVARILGLSERAAREHLRNLFDLGYLDVVAVPGIALGKSPLVMGPKLHLPTRSGLQVLERLGISPPGAEKPSAYRPEQYVLLRHELLVRDVLVWLSQSARLWGHHLERWDCSAGLQVGDARPDALFTYEFGGRVVEALVEVDRGTERGVSGGASDRWAGKIAAYSALFADGRRGRIVVTVEDAARAAWVIKRVAGTPLLGRAVWVAVRPDLDESDVFSAVWLRPDGSRSAFVPTSGESGEKGKG